ncbi:glycosyltransferase family 2 protein [bacterium]|nr:glycosyltransferase family 2 protein [bacterium]
MKPLISVIITTYNRKIFLNTAIESVLKQNFQNFELLIIDDGSTDNTKETVNSFIHEKIKYIYQKNQGVSSARNRGIKSAQAPFISFLDSDDTWKKNKLEIQYKTMLDNPQYLLSHTEEIWYKNAKILNPRKIHKKHHGNIFHQSLKLCAISPSTVMARKDLFDIIGLFDEKLMVCEDYDLWLRFTARLPILLIPEALTIKQGGHSNQLSQKFTGMDKFRIYAIKKLLNNPEITLKKDKLEITIKELQHKCIIYGKGCLKHNKKEEGEYYLALAKKYNYPK